MHHAAEQSEGTTQDQKTQNQKVKGSKNSLGISRGVYSAGMTVKVGLMWTGIIWVATFLTLQFGEKLPIPGVSNFLGWLRDKIHWIHDQKYGTKPLIKALYPVFNHGRQAPENGETAIGTTAFLSFALASLLSHAFQVKGAREGYVQATEAIKRHDAVLAENATLKAQLAQCNAGVLPILQTQEQPLTINANEVDPQHQQEKQERFEQWKAAGNPPGNTASQQQPPNTFLEQASCPPGPAVAALVTNH